MADATTETHFPPPGQPLQVARRLLELDRSTHVADHYSLRYWRNDWLLWRRTRWHTVSVETIRRWVYGRLCDATYTKVTTVRGEPVREQVAWAPTKSKVNDVLDALRALCLLESDQEPPFWFDVDEAATLPTDLVSCRNGLLHPPSGHLLVCSPSYFNLVSSAVDYDPAAAAPTEWLKFLSQVWPDDEDTIKTIQEWYGYVLSGRRDLQKIMLFWGAKRGGKSTIVRVLRALLGEQNVTGASIASLSGQFGKQSMIGRGLAVVADARFSNRVKDVEALVEQLLSISGEDPVPVERKGIPNWEGQLPTRIMIVSNEEPPFIDASGAIISRLLLCRFTKSWYGHEDTTLFDRLRAELPGILNWALEGLARLEETGRFTESLASRESREDLERAASPVKAFLDDCCVIGGEGRPGHPAFVLRDHYNWWAVGHGERQLSDRAFGRQLRAVWPEVERARGSEEPVRLWWYTNVKIINPISIGSVPGLGTS